METDIRQKHLSLSRRRADWVVLPLVSEKRDHRRQQSLLTGLHRGLYEVLVFIHHFALPSKEDQ